MTNGQRSRMRDGDVLGVVGPGPAQGRGGAQGLPDVPGWCQDLDRSCQEGIQGGLALSRGISPRKAISRRTEVDSESTSAGATRS